MSELVNLVQARWLYALALVVGFPALVVALNELSFALARAGRPVAASVRFVRTWVVPLVAFSLFLRWILRLPATSLWVRLTETVFWALTIVAIIGVVNNVVFESARPGSWQRKVPALLRDLIRLLLVAIGLAVVYSFVWGREIEGALAALGVTSIVVGLALQEPLGNLFSGLMLLMERPFEVGETIEVGSVSGKVIEVNWRSAHIEAYRWLRHGRPELDPEQRDDRELLAAPSHPHRDDRHQLQPRRPSLQGPAGARRAGPGHRGRPGDPIAATLGYGDFGIKYRLIYRTREEDRWPVRNELVTRIWYMAKRHGFTLPYPVQVSLLHQQTHPFKEAEPAPAEMLGQFPRLPKIAATTRPAHGASPSERVSACSTKAIRSTACCSWCQVRSRCKWPPGSP